MEGVAVDLDIASDAKVGQGQELVIVIHVLISSFVEELSFNDA